jgi:type IV secretory pathway VirB3-like protein
LTYLAVKGMVKVLLFVASERLDVLVCVCMYLSDQVRVAVDVMRFLSSKQKEQRQAASIYGRQLMTNCTVTTMT